MSIFAKLFKKEIKGIQEYDEKLNPGDYIIIKNNEDIDVRVKGEIFTLQSVKDLKTNK